MPVTRLLVEEDTIRELPPGDIRRTRLFGQPNKPGRCLLTRQSGHKVCSTTSCGHFVFNHNMLWSPKVTPQVIHKLSTGLPYVAIRFSKQPLVLRKNGCLKNKGKTGRLVGPVDVRKLVSLRSISVCGQLSENSRSHAKYTPYVRAHTCFAVPIRHMYMVTYRHV